MLTTRRIAALLCAVPFLAAHAQERDRLAPLRDSVRALMSAQRVPAMAVAVARGNRILWQEGFGTADAERGIRATEHTIFSLASISKPFTATALMALVERGMVSLDRPVNDFLGASKVRARGGDASAATVRHVASHSAGLPLHYQFFYDGGPRLHSDDTAIDHYGFLGYAPGASYFYSNLGFGILGHIVARATGRDYANAMRAEVFEPLGLANTLVSSGAGLGERAALRYDNAARPIAPYDFDHAGGSAVWSSANDLVRFGMFHLGIDLPGQRPILSRASRALMQRPVAPETAPGASYGIGWGTLADDNGYLRISHTGGMPGVSTVLNLYPAESLVVVVLANRSSAVQRIATAIAAEFLPTYAMTRDARRAAAAAGVPSATTGPPRFTPPPSVTGAWRGYVFFGADSTPLTMNVRDDGDVHVQLGATLPTILSGASFAAGWFGGRFNSPIRAPDATPDTEKHQVSVTLTLRPAGNRMTGWVSAISSGAVAYGAVSYYTELHRR